MNALPWMSLPAAPLAGPPDRARQWVWVLVLFAVYLASHPYIGVTHDSYYYTADALRRLEPVHFEREFFFGAGTQGTFSIFGVVYARLMAVLGMDGAHLCLVMLGRTGWFLAAWGLARAMVPGREGLVLACLVLSQMLNYDSQGSFYCAEAFATPRCWAELLCLLSVGLGLSGRRWLAAGALALATVCHPLMTLPCLLLWLLHGSARKFWWGAGAIALATGLLYLLGVEPFTRLGGRFDATWWDSVKVIVGNVLPSQWKATDLLRIPMFCVAALASLHGHSQPRLTGLARSLLGMLLLSWAVWAVAEQLHLIFWTQLQFWRAAWLAQTLAFALWAAGRPPVAQWRLMHWSHAVAMVGLFSSVHWIALCLCFGLALWARYTEVAPARAGKPVIQLLLFGLGLLLLPWDQWGVTSTLEQWHHQPWLLAVLGLVGLGVSRVLHLAWLRNSLAWAAGLLACGVLALTLQHVWHTPPRSDSDFTELARHIPERAVIQTANDLPEAWLDLHRSHYVSLLQSVSVLFSQEMDREYNRRRAQLFVATGWNPFQINGGIQAISGTLMFPAIRPKAINTLCQDPILDFVVLKGSMEGADQVVIVRLPGGTEYRSLYSCASRRAAGRTSD